MVDGAMNRHWYIQILRNQMLPWATGVFGRNFMYVQGNAPPHTARDTAAFLDQQDVEVMDWPARSPDMNPNEHVWDQMSVWSRDMDDPPSTVAELINAVGQAWGPWSRACLVGSGLFWPLEVGIHATSVRSEGQYHVPPICSELFQCAVLTFSFGAKCELGGCALLA